MKYRLGDAEFEAESKYLTFKLPDSTSLLDDVALLRDRMQEDGFLLLRGVHDADEVLEARRGILERLSSAGKLDPTSLMDGVVNPNLTMQQTATVRGHEHLKTESLRRVVYGTRIMSFFERFLGGQPLSYNFQWLRAAGPGANSAIHYDVVYMGRGTQNLYTCWSPLGHIPPELGPLVICLGSNRWQDVLATYGRSDVDRDLTCGYFTKDPAELVDRFGGRWASTTFEPGDVVILNMFTMHASLTNLTNRFRISCDTRYRLANEAVDDRWAGQRPKMHTEFWKPGAHIEPIAESRARWGI